MKNKLLHCLSYILILSVFTSCVTTSMVSRESEYVEAFNGKNYQFIVSKLGAPTRTVDNNVGGNILIYENLMSSNVLNLSNSTKQNEFIHFYMDSNDVCYDVKTNHMKEEVKSKEGGDWYLYVIGAVAGILTVVLLSTSSL